MFNKKKTMNPDQIVATIGHITDVITAQKTKPGSVILAYNFDEFDPLIIANSKAVNNSQKMATEFFDAIFGTNETALDPKDNTLSIKIDRRWFNISTITLVQEYNESGVMSATVYLITKKDLS